MRHKTQKLTGLLLLLGFVVFGQTDEGPWTLQQCIEYAKENNIQARQSLINMSVQEENLKESKQSILPSVSAGASWVNNWGLFVDPFTNEIDRQLRIQNVNGSVNASVPLFQGLQNHYSIQQNKIDYSSAQLDYEAALNNVGLQVSSAYVAILFNMELVRVAENQVNVTQMQVDRIQKEVDAGSRPMGDLYDIEAQLAREEQSLVAAENNLIASKLQLAQLLMLDDYESFEIETPEMEMKNTVLLSMSPTEIYQKSLENQPQIESAELNVQSAEYGVGIAKSAYYPSLRMNGSISTGASDRIADPFQQQWEENFSENLVFSLNIPIYSRRQIKSNVNRSQLNYQNSQLNLKQEKYNLLQNIQTAYNDAKAAFNKYKADEKTVLSLRESFKYVEERYNVGLINAYEYNLSKNQLTAAESEMIRDKFDYIFKLMVLEFYYANEISL